MRTSISMIAMIISFVPVFSQSWTPLSCGSTAVVSFISFPTDDTGYVTLDNNTIRRTTDAGANWSPCTMPANSFLHIDFISGQTGCMILQHGISRTTDGAQTWNTVLNHTSLDFYDVYFLNTTIGFASAINGNLDSLYIYTTTNGGLTWSFIASHGGPYNIFFPELYFTSATTGFTSFDSGILKTTDGGATWNVVYTDPNMDAWCSMSSPDGTNIFGGGQLGWIFASNNAGNSWTAPTQATYPAYGMYFDSPVHGYYCGGNGFGSGTIEVTNNGGNSWSPVYLTSQTLMCMDFPSAIRGYAGGTNGIIVRFDDSPQTIEEQTRTALVLYPDPANNILNVSFSNAPTSLSIVNSIGEKVLSTSSTLNHQTLDVSSLPAGLYFLQAVSEGEPITRQFIIE